MMTPKIPYDSWLTRNSEWLQLKCMSMNQLLTHLTIDNIK